jgi:hypothetical protein
MKETPAPAPARPWPWLVPLLAPVLAAGLVVLGLIAAGRAARKHLRDADRFTTAFTDIDCVPPPGQGRQDFLSEVRYLAGLPDRLTLLDEDLPARLADAFARHPWVEKVARVERVPPRQVRVRLTYRTPVLAVPQSGQLRAVDRFGILLPATAAVQGLPVFPGDAPAPAGPAGTPWGDAAVEQAARAAVRAGPRE